MSEKIRRIAFNALVAALYVVGTLLCYPFAFMGVQFRFSEILVLLCFFRKDYAFGLTIGCAIVNLFSSIGLIDVAFGTTATLLACLAICFSKHLIVAIWAPVIANAFIVAAELTIMFEEPYFISALQVGLGELAVMAVGYIIFFLLRKNMAFHKAIGSNQNLDFKF